MIMRGICDIKGLESIAWISRDIVRGVVIHSVENSRGFAHIRQVGSFDSQAFGDEIRSRLTG